MDLSILEEQYDCLKQKQKLQTHIIVYKTDENEIAARESMINAVVINKNIRKEKTVKESVSTRKVCLELPCSGNIQENSPWRTHLELHRLSQGKEQQNILCDVIQDKNEQTSIDDKILSQKNEESCEEFIESKAQSIGLLNEEEKSCIPGGKGISDFLTSVTSSAWTHSEMTPTSNKLSYYPFPQKKTHKISEAAKRVGLYVSH